MEALSHYSLESLQNVVFRSSPKLQASQLVNFGLRSSLESSRASGTDSKSDKTPVTEFVKPKTPDAKKKETKIPSISTKKPVATKKDTGFLNLHR